MEGRWFSTIGALSAAAGSRGASCANGSMAQGVVEAIRNANRDKEMFLMCCPKRGEALLGTGKKVFEEQPERRRTRLKDSKVVGEGVAVLIYERAA